MSLMLPAFINISKKALYTLSADAFNRVSSESEKLREPNARRRYGYGSSFSASAPISKSSIRTYLLLHAMPIMCKSKAGDTYIKNAMGIIQNLDLNVIADKLKISYKTLRNSLDALVDNGYIFITSIGRGHTATIALREYGNMYLPADQGGRGYVCIPFNVFEKLIATTSLNSLRASLFCLLEYDNGQLTGSVTPGKTLDIATRSLKLRLPHYAGFANVLNRVFSDVRCLQVQLLDNGKRLLISGHDNVKILKLEARRAVQHCIDGLYKKLFPSKADSVEFKRKQRQEVEEISNLSLDYDLETIKEAIDDFCSSVYQGTATQEIADFIRRYCHNKRMLSCCR